MITAPGRAAARSGGGVREQDGPHAGVFRAADVLAWQVAGEDAAEGSLPRAPAPAGTPANGDATYVSRRPALLEDLR